MKEIEIIKQDNRQKITLMYDAVFNKRYIQRRIYDDKREIYKILAKINHPNIPKIFGVEFDSDTVVTEEYVEGKSLRQIMDENTVFTKKQITNIAKQIISAMTKLHNANIIHRDIKPDNLIISESGHVWLIDYDIARIYRDEIRKDTEAMGTFGYAPIEQFGMMPTDFKTDIYAFGVTLSELLVRSGIKGSLLKIAEKCKKLDPAERYQTAKSVKSALKYRNMKKTLLATAVILSLCIVAWVINPSAKHEEKVSDETFQGFKEYPAYAEYKDYSNFSHTLIFSIDEPWEHLLFIDDVNQKGKIKLGRKNTLVDADIALDNGVLSVKLDDKKGNKFEQKFEFENQYSYDKDYTTDLRKNADIICRDLDYDDVPEILIGLNEGAMNVVGHQFYNNFNYCIGWCLKYDEENGFALCEGDMFSKGQAFTLTKDTNAITVPWEDFDDVMGYELRGGKIMPIN